MALHSVGVNVDPGRLNAMLQTFGGYSGNGVYWNPAVNIAEVETLGTHSLKFHFEQSTSAETLNRLLCSGHPVIVQTKLQALQQGGKGHFVLVIGSNPGTNTFFIADPAGRCTTLGCPAYNNQFETRGYVHDPTGDISRLVIAAPNGTLLLTSPTGQRTGTDPATGQTLEAIPQSVSFTDAIANDVTLAPATEADAYIDVFQAAGGVYQVQVTSLSMNPSAVSLDGFSQDGSRQSQVVLPITGGIGATTAFQVKYSSGPGAALQVIRKATKLSYTGDTVFASARPAQLSAVLTEEGTTTPVVGRTVLFNLGSGATAQTCSGTTDATGTARCGITSASQPLGPGTVTAQFAGDVLYLPASNTTATLAFAYLATGSFVVGDQNASIGTTVSYWGAQWAKANALSGGPAPASFKGFAASPSSTPPTCGGIWSTSPGNSAGPPDTVPSYMGVVVSSSINKSGSTISGNILAVIVVQTQSGYVPNPGQPGTGKVVAVVCPTRHQ